MKFLKLFIYSALVLVLICNAVQSFEEQNLVSTETLGPARPKYGCIQLWSRENYKGEHTDVCDNLENLAKIKFAKKASSIKISYKTSVILFDKTDLKGKKLELKKDDPDLGKASFGKIANSLKITKTPTNYNPKSKKKQPKPRHPRKGCAILFHEKNLRGKWAKLCGSSRDLSKKKIKNQVKSIALGPYTKIKVHDDIKYKGKGVEYTKDVMDFVKVHKGGKFASGKTIKTAHNNKAEYEPHNVMIAQPPVITPPEKAAKGCIIVYEKADYQGMWATTCGSNKYLDRVEFGNIVSSVKIGSHCKIKIFSKKLYKGRSIDLDKDEPNLILKGFNEIPQSLQLFNQLPKPKAKPEEKGKLTPKTPKLAPPETVDKGCIAVFSKPHFEGNWAQMCGQAFSLKALHFTDHIASVRVGDDTKVTFFQEEKYKGRSIAFTEDEEDLIKKKLNDMTSSLKIDEYKNPKPKAKKEPEVVYTIKGRFINEFYNEPVYPEGFKFTAKKGDKKYPGTMKDGSIEFANLPAGDYKFDFEGLGYVTFKDKAKKLDSQNWNKKDKWDWKIAPELKPGQYIAILFWGKRPKDLDLTCKYYNKTHDKTEVINFEKRWSEDKLIKMEKDNTEGFGPEVITWTEKGLFPGDSLKFYVHNKSNDYPIGLSGATVKVYKGKKLFNEYKIKKAERINTNQRYWMVFDWSLDKSFEKKENLSLSAPK